MFFSFEFDYWLIFEIWKFVILRLMSKAKALRNYRA
jgi:hypothetical protein